MAEIDVKQIIIKPIKSQIANEFVKKWHYSGKVVPNSQLHFGAFYDNVLHGVMSYGPSMRKDLICNKVKNTGWNDFLELNRMAFDSFLPKNSESRSIAISIKLIKKTYKNIEWIISFADGTQCGDGTIYRASGFNLIGIKENGQLRINPETGEPMQSMSAFHAGKAKEFHSWQKLTGYQLCYIYFINKTAKERLTVPILPFSEIDKRGAKMYLGKNNSCVGSSKLEHDSIQSQEGSVILTPTLHFPNQEVKNGK